MFKKLIIIQYTEKKPTHPTINQNKQASFFSVICQTVHFPSNIDHCITSCYEWPYFWQVSFCREVTTLSLTLIHMLIPDEYAQIFNYK